MNLLLRVGESGLAEGRFFWSTDSGEHGERGPRRDWAPLPANMLISWANV
jgi:hypothetical protein